MGMDTGLRCKIIVKEKYRKDIDNLLKKEDFSWSDCENKILQNFGNINRSDSIPFGDLSYMPDCWQQKKNINESDAWYNMEDIEDFKLKFYPNTGLWCFQCSLKNYWGTIDCFIEDVLSEIVENIIHLEVFYEEDIVSDLYELKDGKITELNYGIEYNNYGCFNDKKNKILYENYNFTKEKEYRK